MDKFNDVAIKCPECDHSFEVSEEVITAGIRDKIESELKAKYEMEIEVFHVEKENMKKSFLLFKETLDIVPKNGEGRARLKLIESVLKQ